MLCCCVVCGTVVGSFKGRKVGQLCCQDESPESQLIVHFSFPLLSPSPPFFPLIDIILAGFTSTTSTVISSIRRPPRSLRLWAF